MRCRSSLVKFSFAARWVPLALVLVFWHVTSTLAHVLQLCSTCRSGVVIMKATEGDPVNTQSRKNKRSKPLYSFEEARAMAQWMGFASKEEWDAHEFEGGRGSYQLPKDPDVVYSEEFVDWEDWLGVMLPFKEARAKSRSLGLETKEAYVEYVLEPQRQRNAQEWAFASLVRKMGGKRTGTRPSTRLPWQPDLYYKSEWQGWEDWLGQ